MRVYTVHVDPLSAADDAGAVLVRDGFSWPAALFSVLWALYHGLWAWALALLVAGAAIGGAAVWLGLDPAGQAVVEIGAMALVGWNAGDMRRIALAHRGYRLFDVVVGDDLAAAEKRFFGQRARALP